jgi:hypothetical protein
VLTEWSRCASLEVIANLVAGSVFEATGSVMSLVNNLEPAVSETLQHPEFLK